MFGQASAGQHGGVNPVQESLKGEFSTDPKELIQQDFQKRKSFGLGRGSTGSGGGVTGAFEKSVAPTTPFATESQGSIIDPGFDFSSLGLDVESGSIASQTQLPGFLSSMLQTTANRPLTTNKVLSAVDKKKTADLEKSEQTLAAFRGRIESGQTGRRATSNRRLRLIASGDDTNIRPKLGLL